MHLIPPPQIPPEAPFNAAQRMWLKGFFDGLSNSADGANSFPSEATAAGPTTPVTLLVGSQTGTAESIAKKLAKTLGKEGFDTTITPMDTTDAPTLTTTENLVVITSTYGDGEPPDNAADLLTSILAEDAPRFDQTQFAVLALGDSSYPDFCECGKQFDSRLEALGATRLHPRLDCDVDYDTEVGELQQAIVEKFKASA